MGLETASFINQLNTSNPVATDGLAQADDHIRLIKSSVKATFPNITGAVTADHGELNKLDGYTGNTADLNLMSGLDTYGITQTNFHHLSGTSSNIQTQISTLNTNLATTNANLAAAVPSGMIMMWSGAVNAIPSGYVLCDGSNSTPDLRNRFVVGAGGGGYAVGDTGGAAQVSLTVAEMPAHTHTYEDKYVGSSANRIDIDYNSNTYDQDGTRTGTTSSTGSGNAHENRPPYYALCYVMKT